MNNLKPASIGLLLLILAAVIVELLFFESRQDPSLRIAALTIVGTLVTGILAIASTLMIGKDITHPQDLPPNSSLQQTTTLNTSTPPVAPSVPASNTPEAPK